MKRNTEDKTYDQADADDPEGQDIGEPNHSLATEPRTRHFLAEDQGVLDGEDDNLSDLFSSMGVEERLDELGM
jgi:hypothetical protein